MHNVDAVYCYCWSSVVCLCVCLFVGHDCESFKTAEPIKMPFGKERLAWAQATKYWIGFTLAPPGEHGGSICTAATIRPVATVQSY